MSCAQFFGLRNIIHKNVDNLWITYYLLINYPLFTIDFYTYFHKNP